MTKRHEGRENIYKEAKLDLATKEVQIYLYGDKNDPYNVALIFEYPKAEVEQPEPKDRPEPRGVRRRRSGRASVSLAAASPRAGEEGGGDGGGPSVPI